MGRGESCATYQIKMPLKVLKGLEDLEEGQKEAKISVKEVILY